VYDQAMLIEERRRHILKQVEARGIVSLRELAEQLSTSEVTVRRDLQAMAAEGLLRRTHGGAIRGDGLAQEPALPVVADQVAAGKAAIAELAVSLVQPGDSILLGPGRTTLALARLLAPLPELTVVTNSLPVAAALMQSPQVDVVMMGGNLRRSIQALVGPVTEQNAEGLRVSQVFLSGEGVTVERGLTTPNLFAAATDQALAAAARQVVVLADSAKIGKDTMCQTVPCPDIDVLITDSGVDAEQLRRLREADLDVRVARLPTDRSRT
jgi:DeoR/GlpR family transcriptional regulator of sugar metabolism